MIIRAVLDTTALRSYATGAFAVGELIGEFSDEGVQFGIPAVCMVEAARGADSQAVALLAVLDGHPDAVWLPVDRDQWGHLAAAAHLLGGIARACAALPIALRQADYIVTAEPDAYPGLNTIDL